MSSVAPNTPIIIGVGEYSERINDANYQALSPVQLAAKASAAAIDDAEATTSILEHIDTIASIRTFEDTAAQLAGPFGKSNCFPRSIAKALGIKPKTAVWEVAGGQSSQHLVNEFCEKIAAGETGMALLTGAEAISTTRHLASQQQTVDWSETVTGSVEDRGPGSEGLSTGYMRKHMLYAAPQAYALLEHARRARRNESREAYLQSMGELFAPFTEVAAQNPHTMSNEVLTASQLAAVSEKNRLIADPYPRRLVSRDQVNQGAALLLTTVAQAEALGIDASRWVFLHGYADVAEKGFMEREDLGASPAAVMALQQAINSANIGIDDINFMDFYSCFPIAVSNICDGLGLSANDPRKLTVAGGLPFFGGAGNNYSMHAIARTIHQLREQGGYGLIGANGGFLSKYSVGVYSNLATNFTPENNQQLQQSVDQLPSPVVTETPEGEATIETYTVVYHKGMPAFAIVIGRLTENNARFLAITRKEDRETLMQMVDTDPLGKTIHVSSTPEANRFSL